MNHRLLICAALAALAVGCGPRQGRASGSAPAAVRDFPIVQIPAMYSDGAGRQAYAAEHYFAPQKRAAGETPQKTGEAAFDGGIQPEDMVE